MKSFIVVICVLMFCFACAGPMDQSPAEYEPYLVVNASDNITGNSGGDILEDKGDYYLMGGDMILYKNDIHHQKIIDAILENQESTVGAEEKTRTMMETDTELWPGGVIPYYFVDLTAYQKDVVRDAMDYIESICNVRFIESSPIPADYKCAISWTSSNWSTASTGFSRTTTVKLAFKGNYDWGIAVHELLHLLGLSHEHQRYDRNSYIRVASNMVNSFGYVIVPQYEDGRLNSKVLSDYDYYSIMHYDDDYITTLDPKMQNIIGQRRGMSLADRATLISLYGKSAHRTNYKIGDFAGDDRMDLLKYEKGTGWIVYIAGSYDCDRLFSTNVPSTQWNIKNYIGDFNGDGKDDMMLYEYRIGLQVYLSAGESFAVGTWADLEPGMYDDLVGDFNNDGKDDFARYKKNLGWYVYLSTGSSFVNAGKWSSVLCQSSSDLGRYKGDFNGDGKDDLLLYNNMKGWRVLQSTGSSFTDKIWNTKVTGTKYVIGDNVGDFNGDGKDDFIFSSYREGTYLMRSTGSSFTGSWVRNCGILTDRRVGDFNGDGKDDLLHNYNNYYSVSLSTGTNFTVRRWIKDFDVKNILIGDFNGDNKSDMLQFVDQTWWKISKSTGDTFKYYSKDPRTVERIYTSYAVTPPGGSVITIGYDFNLK